MQRRELNYNMFKCAEHLIEAGRYMMALNKERGLRMIAEGDMILAVIKPEVEKVPNEKLESIMDEIMNIGAGDK